MFRQPAGGRLFGHPLHPMLVHFPTALFTAGFCFDAAGLFGYGPALFHAAFYCTGAGLAGGVLAGFFGFLDYTRLAETHPEEVFYKASWHGGVQLVVLCLFGFYLGLRYEAFALGQLAEPGWPEMVLSASGVLLLLGGNYLGGDLVFRDGVGVSRPDSPGKQDE